MMAKRGRDVPRRGNITHQEKNGDAKESRAAGNYGKNAGSTPDPIPALSHCGAQQQSQRGIAGHRVIFLRGGKCEEDQDKSGPANGQQMRAASAVNRFKRKLGDGGEVDAPRKKPQEVKKPEPQPGDRIVIAWITQIEKAKDLFVDEIEPKKSVVFTRAAVKRKREIRRISKCGQNVPRRGNQKSDEESADRLQPLPGAMRQELLGQKKINRCCGNREDYANQTLKQYSCSQTGS